MSCDEPVAVGGEGRLGQPAADVGRGRRRELAGGFGLREQFEGIPGRRHQIISPRCIVRAGSPGK